MSGYPATGRSARTAPSTGWDVPYAGGVPPLWDIGRPQAAFARLGAQGMLRGRVLDVGCGTGEHTLLAAGLGCDATGVDISGIAVVRAREKAAARGIAATFEVADALELGRLGATFDTVLDSGTFHVFTDRDRARYVAGLASILGGGGMCHVLCQSDRQEKPLDRPRRVSRDDLRAAFGAGWTVTGIAADVLELNPNPVTTAAKAWLASVRRTAPRATGLGAAGPRAAIPEHSDPVEEAHEH